MNSVLGYQSQPLKVVVTDRGESAEVPLRVKRLVRGSEELVSATTSQNTTSPVINWDVDMGTFHEVILSFATRILNPENGTLTARITKDHAFQVEKIEVGNLSNLVSSILEDGQIQNLLIGTHNSDQLLEVGFIENNSGHEHQGNLKYVPVRYSVVAHQQNLPILSQIIMQVSKGCTEEIAIFNSNICSSNDQECAYAYPFLPSGSLRRWHSD